MVVMEWECGVIPMWICMIIVLQYWDANTRSWYSGNQVAKMSAELRFVSMDPMPIYVYGFAETGIYGENITSTNRLF